MSYIKPGPNYKMSKTLKRSLALSRYVKDPHLLGQIKRGGIQAELAAAIRPTRDKSNKNLTAD